jgi:hypothetical protein
MSMLVAPSARLPQVRTPSDNASLMSSPSGVVHRCPGLMMIDGGVAGSSATVYGTGPRATATSPATSRTGSPRSGHTQAWPRAIATTASGASSRARMHHGGSITARSRNASRARGPCSKPASASTGTV